MRITKESARTVSQYAHELSNGYVGVVGAGSDLGNGSRIMDQNSQHVWLGQPREATVYYLAQVVVFTSVRGVYLTDWPTEVQEIRAELLGTEDWPVGRPSFRQWYETGLIDGRSRVQHYCPEIRGAGKP